LFRCSRIAFGVWRFAWEDSGRTKPS
jgi:hypothetical protein